ncbi:zinc-ribbon domain-containing protein [Citrobacter sp. R56]|uniref:zinc-ribbon domain-containing protein n=1 Tax=Citrobacter sp. R56 TaxID=1573676 RepID=UPI001EEDFACD|nr:zinc-ribbon domain-containing protein [Citrobacter sp. R56]
MNAKETAEASCVTECWTCASYGCGLLLRKGGAGEAPWFERILHSISHQQLIKCAWGEGRTRNFNITI